MNHHARRRRSLSLALVAAPRRRLRADRRPARHACLPRPDGPAAVEPAPSDVAPARPRRRATPTTAPTASPSGAGAPRPRRAPPGADGARHAARPAGTTIVRAYFILGSFTGNAGLVPVLREIPETKAVATAAMTALLEGPKARSSRRRPAMYTGIPDGTKLLGLTIADGVATVDLSASSSRAAAARRSSAGSRQVVYTLTQFPTVEQVPFEVDGEPVTVFGGAGVVLDHPVGRDDYTNQLPAIFVDRPAWGARRGQPGRVAGVANVFEATFRVQLLDAQGRTCSPTSR